MSAEPVRRPWRAAVLTYHSLDDSGSVLSVSPRLFGEQMRVLADSDVRVVPLTTLGDFLSAGGPGAPMVALTFDDGFLSLHKHGLPVLARHGFPATVFVVSDYCGRTNAWPSQPAHVAPQPLMGWAELRELARCGLTPGCHTRTHPDLLTLSPNQVSEEVAGAKARIEDALGAAVETFAYPYGTFDRSVQRLVAEHFSLACATTLAFVGPASDRFAVERIDMYYLRRPAFFKRLFTPSIRSYLRVRRAVRAARKRRRGM